MMPIDGFDTKKHLKLLTYHAKGDIINVFEII